jgi:hypothetical protein
MHVGLCGRFLLEEESVRRRNSDVTNSKGLEISFFFSKELDGSIR